MVTNDGVYILDLAAKIDATADYICKVKWGDVEFPPPFGREAYPEASNNPLWPKSLSYGDKINSSLPVCPWHWGFPLLWALLLCFKYLGITLYDKSLCKPMYRLL